MIQIFKHSLIFIVLTALSQLGGLAWLISICFKRRFITFLVAYTSLSASALWLAPILGREPLPCFETNGLKMQSKLYCILNRHYVAPELREVLFDFSSKIQTDHPNTKTLILDANFPFLTGFPLLPHLSHHDGRKVDLAFYYKDESKYLPGATKSPIGYFAFEEGPTDCPQNFLSLRWDLKWLQPFWQNFELEPLRMTSALRILSEDKRVGKIFIEPHLRIKLGLESSKIRFQGCRAARHDDHIHFQL
jgi:hypothetical protein